MNETRFLKQFFYFNLVGILANAWMAVLAVSWINFWAMMCNIAAWVIVDRQLLSINAWGSDVKVKQGRSLYLL
jgi:hypothetical protein